MVAIEAFVFCNYPKLRNKLSNSDKLFEKIGGMMNVEIKVLEDRSKPRIATWHKKGRRVYLVDKNLDIIEKLRLNSMCC